MLRGLRLGPVGQAFQHARAGRFALMPYLHCHRSFSKAARLVLGVSSDANENMVQKAYRKFAMMYHPKRPLGNEEKYMEVSKAYREISCSKKQRRFSRKEADQLFEDTFGPDVARMVEKGGVFNIDRMFSEFKDDIMGELSGTVKSEETHVSLATEKGRLVKITTKLKYQDGEVLNRSVTKETVPDGTELEPTQPAQDPSATDSQTKMITSNDKDLGADSNSGQQSDHVNKERSSRRSEKRRERKKERSDGFDEDMRQMQQMADKEQEGMQESANQVFGTAQKIANRVSGMIFKQGEEVEKEVEKVDRSSRRKSRRKMDELPN